MKEFMLLIFNTFDHQAAWAPEKHNSFLKKCEEYIIQLQKKGHLISAQPLAREGRVISGISGALTETPFNEEREIQVGYYHIFASSLDEAVEIAKQNPEFEFGETAKVEVRPVKTKESITGFVYPNSI